MKNLRVKALDHYHSFTSAYSSIFFIQSPTLGLAFAVATFLYPNIALSGFVGLISSYFFMKIFQVHSSSHCKIGILCNSLLVSLFIGHLFILDKIVGVLIFLASCFTFLLTLFLDSLFQKNKLPVLSLPFTLVAMMIGLSTHKFTNFQDASPYFFEHSLTWIQIESSPFQSFILSFFRSLGSIFCIPDPLLGAILSLAVLRQSIFSFIFMLTGFSFGYWIENLFLLVSNNSIATHFLNYSLIFPALASVFIKPSGFSLILSMIGIFICSLSTTAFLTLESLWGTPITALPFNLIVLLLLRVVQLTQPLKISNHYKRTPEEAIDHTRLYRLRHRSGEIGLFCPFEGEWIVQQSFDGDWTHKGAWRYALDFVIQDQNQKSYTHQGFELTDYFAFGKPILAPADGTVVSFCSNIPDNPIGRIENQTNWGNYIILRLSLAPQVYVILAHLKQNSMTVCLGEFVQAGKILAQCGNSGYSQEPHLHLQCQLSAWVGDYSLPFHLLNYLSHPKTKQQTQPQVHFHEVPMKGMKICSVPPNLELGRVLSFRIGDKLRFKHLSLQKEHEFELQVFLDEIRGTLYLSDGNGRLYFGKIGTQFYFEGFEGNKNSILSQLFISAPSIPMTYGIQAYYEDFLPLRITETKLMHWVKILKTLLLSNSEKNQGAKYKIDSITLEIQGKLNLNGRKTKTQLKLDPILGIQYFSVGEKKYSRINHLKNELTKKG